MTRQVGRVFVLWLASLVAGGLVHAQSSENRASAYYNFAMGHLYAELASMHGNRGEYLDKAIEHYKQALKPNQRGDAAPGH